MQPMVYPSLLQDFDRLFSTSLLYLKCLTPTCPHDNLERMFLESESYGPQAMNVIACEGSERIERPETNKQWLLQIVRAGFRQLPLNQEMMNTAKDRLKSRYHKDFVIDEDSQCLLQGWKGRNIFLVFNLLPFVLYDFALDFLYTKLRIIWE
nr:scarecrow-like protein 34 [Quercus suber]